MSRTLTITLNDAEADTILAALRNFQRVHAPDLSMLDDPSSVLTADEIDDLCERINSVDPAGANFAGPSPTFG